MNLPSLNLDRYGIPKEAEILVTLIKEELKVRKLSNGLMHIGCDGSYCLPDLSNVIFVLAGLNTQSDELDEFYFALLDKYCEKITYKNPQPIKEAFSIYKQLIKYNLKR